MLHDCSALNLWIMALQERRAISKMPCDHFYQSKSLKSNFGWLKCCMAHTPASCKTLANCFNSFSSALKVSNGCGGQGTLSHSPAKVSAIIITVCTQSGGVLSYRLSQFSEETREFGTNFPWGQDSPNIQYQHSSNPSLYFHCRDKTRQRHGKRGDTIITPLIRLVSSLTIKHEDDCV